MGKVRIQQDTSSFVVRYPQAIEFAKLQEKVFWKAEEIEVEKDIQDMKVNMTDSEYHGVVTTLKLFTLYELIAGDEYWGGRFKRMFPRPDLHRMASTFAYTELGIHAPFYNKINQALMLDTDEFYTDYVNNPVLKERMSFVDNIVNNSDDLVSIGAFSLVEGAVLYSAFAYLKSFQANGKNKILNTVSGINFSVRDEDLHGLGGAWAFNTLLNERKLAGVKSFEDVYSKIKEASEQLLEHEYKIVDMIFEKGDIPNLNKNDMKVFVKSRINICLSRLGIKTKQIKEPNSIAEWFYNDINMQKFGDIFVAISGDYNQNWNEKKLIWQ